MPETYPEGGGDDEHATENALMPASSPEPTPAPAAPAPARKRKKRICSRPYRIAPARKRRPKPRKRKPILAMRECALPGCGQAFYPLRNCQRYCNTRCAANDRKRRERERYRKLKAIAGRSMDIGLGGRKVIKRGSRDITKAEAELLSRLRQSPEVQNTVMELLEDPPRNRSPERTSPVNPMPVTMVSRRLRNIRQVHPRSLEH